MEKPQSLSEVKLESVAEVANVLRESLEFAKTRLAPDNFPVKYPLPVNGVGGEQIDIRERKGIVFRPGHVLNNIAVTGMTPKQAIEAALTFLLGEPQTLPADAPERNLYVVECDFAVPQVSKVPTLRVGKVDRAADALALIKPALEDVVAETERPILTPYIYKDVPVASDFEAKDAVAHPDKYAQKYGGKAIGIHEKSIFGGWSVLVLVSGNATEEAVTRQQNRLRSDSQEQIAASLTGLKDWEANLAGDPLVVWHAGVTDMTCLHQKFVFDAPAPGAKFHLMEVPVPASAEVAGGQAEIQAQVDRSLVSPVETH